MLAHQSGQLRCSVTQQVDLALMSLKMETTEGRAAFVQHWPKTSLTVACGQAPPRCIIAGGDATWGSVATCGRARRNCNEGGPLQYPTRVMIGAEDRKGKISRWQCPYGGNTVAGTSNKTVRSLRLEIAISLFCSHDGLEGKGICNLFCGNTTTFAISNIKYEC